MTGEKLSIETNWIIFRWIILIYRTVCFSCEINISTFSGTFNQNYYEIYISRVKLIYFKPATLLDYDFTNHCEKPFELKNFFLPKTVNINEPDKIDKKILCIC